MKLSIDQLRSAALGAVRVAASERGARFYRFTEEQETLYQKTNDDFYLKTFATAGVRLQFRTDSSSLFLRVSVVPGSSRSFFAFDIYVNGKHLDSLDNFAGVSLPQEYPKLTFPLGEYEKRFSLGDGMKTVCIYFPWSVSAEVLELSLDDGAAFTPVKPEKKLLAFGDSITQGYDALQPSHRYTSALADFLGAEEINKGIGAEIVFPALARCREDFEPDYITVAYGTNDWSKTDAESFRERCMDFYGALSRQYPAAKIFALAPIWRADHRKDSAFGAFEEVEKILRETADAFENVTCIRCFEFTPPDPGYYSDLYLHPNDSGFAHYAKNLCEALQQYR